MSETATESTDVQPAGSQPRRSFIVAVVAGLFSVLVGLVPLVAGVIAFFDPLRRKSQAKPVRVTTLDSVPDDGRPRLFKIVTDRVDAWTRYPTEQVGAVYLVRQPGAEKPTAFSATCPHAGCFVGLQREKFLCPCHTSAFEFNGDRIGGSSSVSPRDLDTLDVEIQQSTTDDGSPVKEVVVMWQRFLAGKHEKIPI